MLFRSLARGMSKKSTSHFNVLLQDIAERTAAATNRLTADVNVPVSPYQISYNFLASCRSLDFDKSSVELVQELFERFVLDRMGSVYGDCNQRLEECGFHPRSDEELVTSA